MFTVHVTYIHSNSWHVYVMRCAFALNECAEKFGALLFSPNACVFTCEHNFIYGFSYRYHNFIVSKNILLIKIHRATIFTFVTPNSMPMCSLRASKWRRRRQQSRQICLRLCGKPLLNAAIFSNVWTLYTAPVQSLYFKT